MKNLQISFPFLKLLYLKNGREMTIFRLFSNRTCYDFFLNLDAGLSKKKNTNFFPLKLSSLENVKKNQFVGSVIREYLFSLSLDISGLVERS